MTALDQAPVGTSVSRSPLVVEPVTCQAAPSDLGPCFQLLQPAPLAPSLPPHSCAGAAAAADAAAAAAAADDDDSEAHVLDNCVVIAAVDAHCPDGLFDPV